MSAVLALDLAAKYSAACLMTAGNAVTAQWDSWGHTEAAFIATVVAPWRHEDPPLVLAVEDLPHRLPFAALVKRVCRIQGRIIEAMDRLHVAHLVLFVPPAVWRKHFDGLGRGTGPDAVVPVAAGFGYHPPELAGRVAKAGDKAIARKVATDYCAAYLIARWAVDNHVSTGSFDAPGTSRYTTPEQVAHGQ